mmetsp:Transcript_8298/g.11489  ORF Transcript_8298/g.11489 Transcript_8298/m.11489 type:complete len:97 (+) Transcript_8298:247-537(+)|eukprot:CAMPEP_0185581254 /NCGR_PEP_ID=MMETSP0434-20130131/18196_1 /TAXON_ID=626734 ORGANISM="Favella taraikaensis, Strain Fe Narragansett Bay" /NCGR_SAMPLE_ID=MMETSP0434 /ASSEMBLY_ACC=CAM_ASM_000379 /LENGTH=96 /DNA_ID=CAMNT_0028199743 /DNA_START=244 /DNA_END=534 /DNA_ORIENTATION=+
MKTAAGGQAFLPTEISESIVMPNDDFMVTFRNSNHCKHIPLPSWFSQDVPRMCKKLIVRELTFDKRTKDVEQVGRLLGEQLVTINKTDRLNVIGGI